MPERLEYEALQKERYINTFTFSMLPLLFRSFCYCLLTMLTVFAYFNGCIINVMMMMMMTTMITYVLRK